MVACLYDGWLDDCAYGWLDRCMVGYLGRYMVGCSYI
jgi:hypothetical protein